MESKTEGSHIFLLTIEQKMVLEHVLTFGLCMAHRQHV